MFLYIKLAALYAGFIIAPAEDIQMGSLGPHRRALRVGGRNYDGGGGGVKFGSIN